MPPFVESAARINLRWVVRLRWGAVAGQLIAILLAQRYLQQPLPVGPLLAVCAALAAGNLGVQLWLARGGRPTDRASALHLLGDILGLTALLALSGGTDNPFALLYLVHITIAAIVLPQRWSLLLATASIAAYSLLDLLPIHGLPLIGDTSLLHVRGRWLAFVVAAAFISTFSLRMSDALRRRERELTRAKNDAEAAERLGALGTLAAGTAHELNTPLGTIAILAGELAHSVESPEASRDVEEIRRQIRRCKEIISNMLAPRGGDEEPKEFEVASVLEAVVRRWQAGRRVQPELDIDVHVRRARVRLPIRAFEQAVANLLDNAADATEGRSAASVRVVLSRRSDELQLTVEDNGSGVPEPLRGRIGEPFFTTKGPGKGTGLGLYLARHVVEAEGGEMVVDSAEGRGTTVRLTVPEA